MYLLNKYQNNKLVDTYDATAYLCDLRAEDVHVARRVLGLDFCVCADYRTTFARFFQAEVTRGRNLLRLWCLLLGARRRKVIPCLYPTLSLTLDFSCSAQMT